MSTTYVSFTPAEREQARTTDLAAFLRRQGDDLKREGRGAVWMNGGEKVSIQGNLWYNQYTREGGDAIDFARRFFDCTDYPSAVRFLLGADVGAVAVIVPKKKKEPKPFAMPPANSDMHRIYAYLMKQRGIDRDVIRAFTHAKLLYEEAIYHNCVFVGYDENGIARHAHKRGRPPAAALSATRTEATRNTAFTGREHPSACSFLKRRSICSLISQCTRRIGRRIVMSRSARLLRLRQSR